jgi:predicted nucleic acid-binding protein
LLERIWELRDRGTVYDGAYLALGEVLGVAVLTADSALTRVPGLRCDVEALTA